MLLNIEDGFENSDRICKMIEDVVEELGISQKREKIMIKHAPAESPIDMNSLRPDNISLELEIVDSLITVKDGSGMSLCMLLTS